MNKMVATAFERENDDGKFICILEVRERFDGKIFSALMPSMKVGIAMATILNSTALTSSQIQRLAEHLMIGALWTARQEGREALVDDQIRSEGVR